MTNNKLFSHSHSCRAMFAMTTLLLMLFFTTLGNAQLVKDINVGATGSNPNTFVAVGNKAIFIADDANLNGRKVYQSDGTTAGTVPVSGYSGTISDYALTVWNGQAYFVTSVFSAANALNSILLYRTNGTTTALVDTLISGNPQTTQYSAVVTVINNQLYYSLSRIGFRDSDVNLYAHNGQRNGSKIITTTARTVSSSGGSFGTTISKVFYGTNTFYLSSESSGSSPFITREISVVRNTTPTSMPKILNTSTFSTLTGQATGYPISPLETIGDLFYGVNQDSLFRFDSTGVKTLIKTGVGTTVSFAQKLGNVIYFASNGNRLWKTDGTAAGTVQITTNLDVANSISNIISQNNSIYIGTTAGNIVPSLYKLSGNTLTLIGSDSEGRFYNYFTYNGKLYWYYGDTFGGFKVFEEGATLALTRTIITNGRPGNGSVTGNGTVTADGLFLLALDDKTLGVGTELWRANLGSPAVTLPDLTIKLLDVKLANPFDNYNNTIPYRTTLDIKYQVATTQFIPTSVGVNNTFTAYVSRDANLSTDDVNLGAAYQPAQTDSLAIRLTYNGVSSQILFYGSESLTTGSYYLILVVDAPNRIGESNENNNVSNAIPFMYYRQTCNSTSNAPWDLWISNVNFNTISNPSGQIRNFPLGGFTKGYTNFIDKNTTISTGSSYPLSITRSTSWTANPAAVYTRAWIDYNQDGDYLDAGEMVLQGNVPSSQVITGNVIVPTTAQIGFTTMRISSKFTAYAAPCDSFDIGEVEDYGITIQAGTVTQLPDFTLANLVLRDPSVLAGTNINFTLDAKNIGTGSTTSPLGYKVYLSVDQTFSVNDVQVGSSNLPTLSSGQTITGLSGSAGSTGFTGTYYIIVKVDADNVIPESNENNNVVVSTTTVTINPVVNNSCRYQDSLQLVSIYNATNGANWTIKWNLSTPINTWYGVTLNANGCVFRLSLERNNLVGTLPNLNIPNLVWLYMYENKLSGTIPNFNLPNLVELVLVRNQLTGTIPNFNLPNLKQLHLATNNLTGTIPNFNLPNLVGLLLSQNPLSGSIPNFNLPNLEELLLTENQLTGAIPNFNLPKLKSLWLYNNNLTSAIPNFNLPNLTQLLLSGNQLTGAIPNFILPNLTNMQLQVNRLSGIIPNFNMPKLIQLLVNDNQLTGAIPSFNYPNIIDLRLDNNNLSGCIPTSLNAFCGRNVAFTNNPLLATQSFAAFCSNNIGACTSTSSNVNIGLSLGTNNTTYMPFTNVTMQIGAINYNSQPFTNVKIEFKFPAKTVSGGTAVPTYGTWQEWCSGGIQCFTWTIPTLPANVTGLLDVPLFVLDATSPIVFTAKLLASTPTDQVVVDNIQTYTINRATVPAVQPLAFQVPTQQVPVVIQRISPNPTEGDVQVKLDSWTKQEVDFNFSDITGKTIHSEKRQLDKGVNKVDFDLYHLPQGVYFIQTNAGQGKNVPTKFVKM
jgi:hypothetical protein